MQSLAEANCQVEDISASNTILTDARICHVEGISELYKSVHINESRLKDKLDTENPDNYLRTGGIFAVLKESELEKMIYSEEYHVLVALSREHGCVVAYGSYHLNGGYRFGEHEINDTCSQLSSKEYTCFMKSLDQGKAAYGVDWITLPAWRRQRLCARLQDLEYSRLRNVGYTHVFYEIYTIVAGDSEYPNPNDSLSVTKFHTKRAGSAFKNISVGNKVVFVRSDFHVRVL